MLTFLRYLKVMLVLLALVLCVPLSATGSFQGSVHLQASNDISARLVDNEQEHDVALMMEQGEDGDEEQLTAQEISELTTDGGEDAVGDVLLTEQTDNEERLTTESFGCKLFIKGEM